ncbi:MAG: DinB family protein [Gemmatimonadetes bacterium]|nr:DinB family protein [Gemmatimonadota bacterium]
MTPAERRDLITRYAEGPERLREALAEVPEEMLQWRPAPGKWSVHEVVVHCADSEANAHGRIRTLIAERDPVILGYDQDEWARRFDYHSRPMGTALVTVEAVRANTVPILESLSDSDWKKQGRHTESGAYGAEDWLRSYGTHLEVHAAQIRRNVAAWKKR